MKGSHFTDHPGLFLIGTAQFHHQVGVFADALDVCARFRTFKFGHFTENLDDVMLKEGLDLIEVV